MKAGNIFHTKLGNTFSQRNAMPITLIVSRLVLRLFLHANLYPTLIAVFVNFNKMQLILSQPVELNGK